MDPHTTKIWLLRWWQENGFRAQGDANLEGLSMLPPSEGSDSVTVTLRLDVPPDLIEYVEEILVLSSPQLTGNVQRDDDIEDVQRGEIIESLYSAMSALREKLDKAVENGVTAQVGPIGTGPVGREGP